MGPRRLKLLALAALVLVHVALAINRQPPTSRVSPGGFSPVPKLSKPSLSPRAAQGHQLEAEATPPVTPIRPTVEPGLEVEPQQQNVPLRVGLLVEPSPFTHVSGYANRFNEMLRWMDKSGDQVEVVTPEAVPEVAPSRVFGARVNTIKGWQIPWYKLVTVTWDRKLRALAAMRRFKPQLLHVTTPGCFVFSAALTAWMLNVPLVMSYHTHLPIYAKNYFGWVPGVEQAAWFALRVVLNRADLNLVTSPQMKDELEKNGIQRVTVWRKGVDIDVFNPAFRDTSMRSRLSDGHPKDTLLVYVGRLGAEKRIKDLKAVLEALPDVRLAIVGKGPQEQELREHFKGTKTVFTGELRGEDLSSAFASADVFCMPSDSETLGFVVLESMASGVPVVGARAGGIPSIIGDGDNGLLFEPGNQADLVAKVRSLVRDPVLRKTMACAARCEAEQWGWESATSYLRNVQYRRAVANFQDRMAEQKKALFAQIKNAWCDTLDNCLETMERGWAVLATGAH